MDINITSTQTIDTSTINTSAIDASIVSGAAYEAGTGINITNNTISVDQTVIASKEWVEDQGYLTEHQSLADYSTTAEMNAAISAHHDNTKQDNISDLTTIRSGATLGSSSVQPGDNVSDLVNDAGYLTQHQSLAAYRTSAAQDVIDAGKQDTLTAGTNISISNNVINSNVIDVVKFNMSSGSGTLDQETYNRLINRNKVVYVLMHGQDDNYGQLLSRVYIGDDIVRFQSIARSVNPTTGDWMSNYNTHSYQAFDPSSSRALAGIWKYALGSINV